MSEKYHVSSDGNPRKCEADVGECPLGGSHFSSTKEAAAFYEENISRILNIPQVVDCDSYTADDYVGRAEDFLESLSKKEKSFIEGYVNQNYSDVNESLWAHSGGTGNKLHDAVNNALSQSQGDNKSLWRMPPRNSVKEVIQGKRIGDTIQLKGFTSTSETPRAIMPMMRSVTDMYMEEVPSENWENYPNSFKLKVPEEYKKNNPNIVFQFVTNKGGAVSLLSHMPQEKETLLPSNTEWKIVGIKNNVEFSTRKDMFGNDSVLESNQATVYQLMEA